MRAVVREPRTTGLAARTILASSQLKVVNPNVGPVTVLEPKTDSGPPAMDQGPRDFAREQGLTVQTDAEFLAAIADGVFRASNFSRTRAHEPLNVAMAPVMVFENSMETGNIRSVHHRFLSTVEGSEALGVGSAKGLAHFCKKTGRNQWIRQGPYVFSFF